MGGQPTSLLEVGGRHVQAVEKTCLSLKGQQPYRSILAHSFAKQAVENQYYKGCTLMAAK